MTVALETLFKPVWPVGAPRVAIVIPIFRHSTLLAEAIESVLHQDAPWPMHVVLVNDGCPHRETDLVCRSYARTYPGRISYHPKPNGGLSAARNAGIRHALETFDSVEAIYLLDADNRLRPHAMRRAMAALEDHPEAGWVYPDIDMFGLRWNGDYGGPYSRLIHTQMNVCEAGSLVRRAVFDAGCFFDESFKSGFEDWDFFLTAGDAGFRGVNIEDFGFQYRKRGESMLSGSERVGAALRVEIKAKHKALFSPRGLLALEQQEAPRYAIHLADRGEVLLTVDPLFPDPHVIPVADYIDQSIRAFAGSTRHVVPAFLVSTDSAVWAALGQSGMTRAVLWALEKSLDHETPFGLADITVSPDDNLAFDLRRVTVSEPVGNLLMAKHSVLRGVLRDGSTAWARALLDKDCRIPLARLAASLPEHLDLVLAPAPKAAATAFVDLCEQALEHPGASVPDGRWEWRVPGIDWRERTAAITAGAFDAKAAYPAVSDGRRHIGIVLPVVEFGGVERVALNLARALKHHGFALHLFVIESRTILFSREWAEVFESVTFLADPAFKPWGAASTSYFGTNVPDWARWGDQGDALAMLGWLDAVINFHGGAISALMGRLRGLGVLTANSLHLSDRTSFERPVGNTYLGLAFEHAYDVFLPCSQQLADWLHGMGVPQEKILAVPNAPSFALPETPGSHRVPMVDPETGERRPLRALYIGRLDAQKGLDRLEPIIEQSQVAATPVDWRVVGKAVIAHDGPRLSPVVEHLLEPPRHSPDGMTEVLEWADVLVLPSYYEGLPLIILEAMRAGTVPMATDVGAVGEVVEDGKTGVLLSSSGCVAEALAALERLSTAPELVAALSANAQAAMAGRDWDTVVRPLVEILDARWGGSGP